MRTCIGTGNAHPSLTVNTTLAFPGQARNKAQGSSTRGQQAQAWLRLALRPHADVCSCCSSTGTCSAPGWALLPEFCQGHGLEMLGSSHCTDPACPPSGASFPGAQNRLPQAQFQGPHYRAEGTPLDPHRPPQKEGCHTNRPPVAEACVVKELPSEKMRRCSMVWTCAWFYKAWLAFEVLTMIIHHNYQIIRSGWTTQPLASTRALC